MEKKMKNGNKNLEYFIGFGLYQVFHLLMENMNVVISIGNMAFMVFAGAFPDIDCKNFENVTLKKGRFSKEELCDLFNNGSCENTSFVSDFNSIISEWGLVCEKAGLVYLSTSAQMAGVMIGAPIFGQLSDLFGRKKTLFVCNFANFFVGALSACSSNFQAFIAFRFAIGFFTGGSITCGYVFLVEFLKQKHRFTVMAIGGWPLCYMSFGLIAFLTRDWRKLTIALNVFGILPLTMLYFTFESPKWLLQRGRGDEAKKVFQKLSKLNRIEFEPTDLENMIRNERIKLSERKTEHPSFFHLFYTWKLVRYTAALSLAWFTVSCVSYGLLFNMEQLSGDRFLNALLYGLMEILSSSTAAISEAFFHKCGRKAFHIIAGGIITFGCFAVFTLVILGKKEDHPNLMTALCLLAQGTSNILWMVSYLMTAEVYPTPIRNIANSFCSVSARVGGILAPQIIYLGHVWGAIPFLIFGLLAAADVAVFQLVLPETKGKPLPDLMPSKQERIWRKKDEKKNGENADDLEMTKLVKV